MIRNEANRLERLVADLLDLAKVQMSGFSLTIVPMDLANQAKADSSGFVPTAQSRASRCDVEAAAPVTVLADPDRVSQIIANLIENALRYARSSVIVSVSQAGGHGLVTVDDDGTGIATARSGARLRALVRRPRAARPPGERRAVSAWRS